jgi:hypothetical protein
LKIFQITFFINHIQKYKKTNLTEAYKQFIKLVLLQNNPKAFIHLLIIEENSKNHYNKKLKNIHISHIYQIIVLNFS